MRKLLYISCVIILSALKAGGQNKAHTNERAASHLHKSPFYLIRENYSTTSPLFAPYIRISSAEIRHNYRNDSRTALPQLGNGHNEMEFRAETSMIPDKNTAVSGGASYIRGRKHNVIWNTTSDYMLLYPHVMADSVGGHLEKEQYSFYGKIAKRKKDFIYGIECSYRALHEYRQVDPRPSNIVSDFSFGGAAGIVMQTHAVSISGRYRKYHQSQDVDFADQKGANTTEFFFTGLGSHFKRFAGASAFSDTRYRGKGASLSILIEPVSGEGAAAGLLYSWLNTTRHLRNQNEAPVTELSIQNLSALISYNKNTGNKLAFRAEARGGYELRQGTENIIDNVATGSFRNLLGMTMYRNHKLKTVIKGSLEYNSGYGLISFTPSLGMDYSYAYHLFPSRKMEHALSAAGAGASYMYYNKNWLTKIDVGASRVFVLSRNLDIPQEYTLPKIYAFYNSLHSNLTESRTLLGLSGRVQLSLTKETALYIKSDTSFLLYDTGGKALTHIFSLGIVF